ncbi:MAG TPA: hypothetical protein VNB67_06720 [Nitrososphaeraceae archaeon]|nr:hypothetical protein [Nitrososphaeraceae archaeon]
MMDYYLLPVEDDEAVAVEEALKKINYDVDDRASVWGKEVINKIVNAMTKENAPKMISDFLPDPIRDKFINLFGLNFD